MSTIPPRAQLKSFHWAGRYTFIALAGQVIAVIVSIQTGLHSSIPSTLGILLAPIGIGLPLWIGVILDRKNRIKRMLAQLESLGYTPCDPDLLDEDLIEALDVMEPYPFDANAIRFASRGLVNDHEVTLLELVSEVENNTTTFTGCAIWVSHQFQETLIRRRTIKDRLSKLPKLGVPQFDKQRIIQSDDHQDISELLLDLSDWFVTNRKQISSFRMGQPPGKVEQWVFLGQWIVLVDQGSAYAKQHQTMANFLIAFVEEFESQFKE